MVTLNLRSGVTEELMFTVRATESWGAPEEVQAAFLLDRKLDLVATTEPVYLGRERGTGHHLWIKCSDGSRESNERLAREERLLAGLGHPHILPLIADREEGAASYLLFPWQAELPLDAKSLAELPCADRARLAVDFVEVICFLQSRPAPVAHNRLVLENLWMTPRVHWLRLSGFSHAVAGASAESLRADRQAALDLLEQIVDRKPISSDEALAIDDAGAHWLDDPTGHTEAFSQTLRRGLLACVTADL